MGLSINSFFADVRRGDLGAVKRALGSQPGALHARAGADQRTALHVAADVGNHLVLRTLLAQGADCAAADAAGEVPLMLAARQVWRRRRAPTQGQRLAGPACARRQAAPAGQLATLTSPGSPRRLPRLHRATWLWCASCSQTRGAAAA